LDYAAFISEEKLLRKISMITLPLLLGLLTTISVSDSAQTTEFPPMEQLPVVRELPDPFLFMNGTRVQTKRDWTRRRQEIKQLVQQYAYGTVPATGGNVTAEELESTHNTAIGATEKRLLLRMGPGGKVQTHLMLTIPLTDQGRRRLFPVLIVGDLCWGKVDLAIAAEAAKRGYILAEFDRTEIAHDKAGREGGLYDVYPDGDFGALAAWAWGFQRVVDYLLTRPDVDAKHLVATGHSRGGKAVLLAGALDERIAITAPNDAGCMGTGSTRFSHAGSETPAIIVKNFPFWFSLRLAQFVGQEERLPFDQHTMKALIAPRALFETQALEDQWANPQGAQATHQAAKVVYDFLGVGDKIGIVYRPGGHAHLLSDWEALLDFADHQFFGKPITRRFDALPYPDQSAQVFAWKAPSSK
jgi:hypothetical protein